MNSRISDTRSARKNISFARKVTRVWPISWLAISRAQAYFARFTTPERSEGLVSRGQWSKQTNEPIRARITSVRVDGRALNAGKNRGNVTILPLIGGGCFARLGHSIENYYTGRRYIRHWLPTPHLDTITFNPLCHLLIPWGKGVESS